MKQNIRYIILLTILFLLLLPFLQLKLHIFKENQLKGVVEQVKEVYFSFDGWTDGTYQEGKEKFINENFGLRTFFVRLNNQIAFNLFNKAKANGVIIGEKNYLYEENYLKAYNGLDYIGTDSIQRRMNRLRVLNDYMTANNKTLLLVFAAGKGSFYPEYFPESWKQSTRTVTNFDTYLSLAKEFNLNYIDFNSYFLKQKENSEYPLFPKYGIHWSHYGMCLAADSIFNYLEDNLKVDLAEITWDSILVLESQKSDYDIADGMNLLCPPAKEKLAYPNMKVISSDNDQKLSAVVIADSYYWGMFNEGIPAAIFSDQHFWFYNKLVYPDSFESPLEVSQLNLSDEIKDHDIFIILCTEANLPNLGWGFIEQAHSLITNPALAIPLYKQEILDLMNYIKTDEKWMNSIKEKALERNISVDSMLFLDAEWQVKENHKN